MPTLLDLLPANSPLREAGWKDTRERIESLGQTNYLPLITALQNVTAEIATKVYRFLAGLYEEGDEMYSGCMKVASESLLENPASFDGAETYAKARREVFAPQLAQARKVSGMKKRV